MNSDISFVGLKYMNNERHFESFCKLYTDVFLMPVCSFLRFSKEKLKLYKIAKDILVIDRRKIKNKNKKLIEKI